ncbi:hypothetical protein [Caballeronia sp. LZ032]|uniref:hypothetical protein n=1 Tax=Caballeronia sp. LZ032 TaxID=3038565 RepID=UPI002859FCB6|nr:hypothetical protein [Caballeronia sp. LZ032]MDR5883581.1 hypothetical protein [Caballeronia sp. LZ032]
MKNINHMKFRTSPLGGYSAISGFERRSSGRLARFGKDAVALDLQRMKKRIEGNDAKRGGALVFGKQRFELLLKCLKVLGIGQRVAYEERQHARQNLTNESKGSLGDAENIIHRRARVARLLLCHVNPVSSGDSGGDSSACGSDGSDDTPFWPHHRGTMPDAKADIESDAASRLRAEFEHLNRSAMSDDFSKLNGGQPRPAREVIDGKPIWYWSFDRSDRSDENVSVCVEYRAGRIASIRRFSQAQPTADHV